MQIRVLVPSLLLSGLACAQMPNATPNAPRAAGGAPMAGQAAGGRPAPAKAPPFELALDAVQTALAACKAQGLDIAVIVTDVTGAIKVGMVPDGVPAMMINFAQRKAATALEFKMSSGEVQALTQSDKAVAEKVAAMPNLFPLPGALLIKSGDELLGVIAGAGARKSEDDLNCAKAGLDKLLTRLKPVIQ